MSGSKSGKKRKTKGGKKKRCCFFKSLKVIWGGGVPQQRLSASLSAPMWSEAAISDQSTDPWYFEDRVHFVHWGCHRVCASCSKNRCIAACLPAGWWLGDTQLWNWLKFTTIYLPNLPLELTNLWRNCRIIKVTSDTFCWSRCGEIPGVSYFTRIPSSLVYVFCFVLFLLDFTFLNNKHNCAWF